MIRELPSETVEYIEFGVHASDDPTLGTVSVGHSDTDDAPTVWTGGEWASQTQVAEIGDYWRRVWVARFLYGTGALDLPEGTYQPWVKIVIGTENIIRRLDDDTIVII